MAEPFHLMVKMFCPDNVHPMPIAEAWDGAIWTVDIQVRTCDGMDIDGTGTDPLLARARAKAMQRIRKTRTMYEKHGYVAN